MIDKKTLFGAVVRQLEEEIAQLEVVLGVTHQTINDSPGAMQSHSDTTRYQTTAVANEQTRSLGMKYRSLSDIRFFATTRSLGQDDEICLGAVFSIDDGSEISHLILLPGNGGITVPFGDREYFTMTPEAPLAKQLLGRKCGDSVKFVQGKRSRDIKIIEIL